MKKRTALRAVVAAAIAVAGSLAVLPSAAQAVYTCQNNEVCIFSDYDLKGTVLIVYSGTHNFTSDWHFANGLAANDNASSIINKTSHWVFAYEDFDKGWAGISGIQPGGQMNFKGRGIKQEIANDSMSCIWVQD